MNVFARVAPEHKLHIVEALQNLGHVVAMTGDGVNDAPALKKANIGVAVGSGTQTAKEAGDFVLLDDSFSSIVGAVEEGRGIYDNIQKSIMLLLSGNLGEVLIIFLAVIAGLDLPLTAVLLLWINLVTDGAPALAFSVDPYGRDIMDRRPLSSRESILPRAHLRLLGFLGVVGSLLGLVMFYYVRTAYPEDEALLEARTVLFNFVVLYEVLLVFMIRREYAVPIHRNAWLWLAVLLSIALQALIVYTPLQTAFGVVPVGWPELALLGIGGALFYAAYIAYSLSVRRRLVEGR